MSVQNLNALLGSRICHDLISPLGAIGNGVELLAMSGVGETPEVALISESVENANARIRFFRIAFGAASTGQGLNSSEVRNILGNLYRSTRLAIDWQAGGSCERQEVKLAFLLMQCLETAMPWGGRVTVWEEAGRWHLSGAAERLSVDPDLWAHLAGAPSAGPLTSANVHFGLAPEVARELGRKIEAETGASLISISF